MGLLRTKGPKGLVLRTKDLDTELQVGSPKDRLEGQTHLPQPAGHPSFAAVHVAVCLLDCKCMMLTHVQLFICQNSQVLLCRAALNELISQTVLMPGIVLTQVQHFALGLVESRKVLVGPLLKFVHFPLDDIPSFCCVICKPAESALDPTICVIDEHTEEHQSQDRALRDTTRHWSPPGHRAIDHNCLDVPILPIPYPLNSPSIKSMSLQFESAFLNVSISGI
ncbi:hypothetical protein WISP_102395 [Willisornis vidua]|uniref:Uncharacterized protein n=1 Tax=Willisornis vidua TaxID=1566151 RepID=A0ABQ9D2N5_9PASS|nr:hypothetical protein WISP_102395 [Willisornis vidua]